MGVLIIKIKLGASICHTPRKSCFSRHLRKNWRTPRSNVWFWRFWLFRNSLNFPVRIYRQIRSLWYFLKGRMDLDPYWSKTLIIPFKPQQMNGHRTDPLSQPGRQGPNISRITEWVGFGMARAVLPGGWCFVPHTDQVESIDQCRQWNSVWQSSTRFL